VSEDRERERVALVSSAMRLAEAVDRWERGYPHLFDDVCSDAMWIHLKAFREADTRPRCETCGSIAGCGHRR
jgi:hypothetical protein